MLCHAPAFLTGQKPPAWIKCNARTGQTPQVCRVASQLPFVAPGPRGRCQGPTEASMATTLWLGRHLRLSTATPYGRARAGVVCGAARLRAAIPRPCHDRNCLNESGGRRWNPRGTPLKPLQGVFRFGQSNCCAENCEHGYSGNLPLQKRATIVE